MKLHNRFITIAFTLILLIPTLDAIFHFSPVKELFEKRLPVAKPEFVWSHDYHRNFEKFFDDNYGTRKSLIFLNALLMDRVFNESPDSRAVFGREGWLYFDNRDSLLDVQGKAPLGDELVARGVKSFYQNWQKARAQNIHYLLIIVPDKTTIYPEFLPDYIKSGTTHRIDKFLAALKKSHPDFPVLDLRPTLISAKKHEIIYHQTDTHWNRRGAHYAYVEIMKRLGERTCFQSLPAMAGNGGFPVLRSSRMSNTLRCGARKSAISDSSQRDWKQVLKPHLRQDFIDRQDQQIRGDIADIMGVNATNIDYDLQRKFRLQAHERATQLPFHKPQFFVNENKNLPRLFVYKDSFFGNLADFVSEHFSQSLYINEFPCDLDYDVMKNFHPNFVIQQFWEGRVEEVLGVCRQ
ncbi:MAG: hypothetical protein FJX34_01395 [Alphaproteobacteria bacterium]|nr:hypothetical protein [Alphaproteobacteria bacterium]